MTLLQANEGAGGRAGSLPHTEATSQANSLTIEIVPAPVHDTLYVSPERSVLLIGYRMHDARRGGGDRQLVWIAF